MILGMPVELTEALGCQWTRGCSASALARVFSVDSDSPGSGHRDWHGTSTQMTVRDIAVLAAPGPDCPGLSEQAA
jgi:hypothetical protein